MSIRVRVDRPSKLTVGLLLVVLVLTAASLIGQICKYHYGAVSMHGFIPFLYVDEEANIPTWYSSIALLFAAALLAAIATTKQVRREPFRWHWGFLAALFFMLSMDEIVGFHEYPIDRLRSSMDAGGLLYYTWVVPGAMFVAALGIVYLRFLFHLPRETRKLFLLSAVVFVGGAIGVEMLSGYQADLYGEENLTYALIISLEECMEMLGVVVFIHSLLGYLCRTGVEFRIELAPPTAQTDS